MLTASDVAQFKRDGFFIARGVFSESELERLRELAHKIQQKTRENFYGGTRYWYRNAENVEQIPPEDRARSTWGVSALTRKALFEPDLINVFAHPHINQAMHALLDQPRAWGIKILWNPEIDGYDLQWHRDFGDKSLYDYVQYKPEAQDHVQFNAALYEDNSFVVIPGSHRRALTEQEWDAVNSKSNVVLPGEVEASLKPGDIVYMDAHALHRGRCPVDARRLTLHYSAQAQWVPLKPWGHEVTEQEDFWGWLTSDEFLSQIAPAARPYYERLRTAQYTDDALDFIREAAKAHGWQPEQV